MLIVFGLLDILEILKAEIKAEHNRCQAELFCQIAALESNDCDDEHGERCKESVEPDEPFCKEVRSFACYVKADREIYALDYEGAGSSRAYQLADELNEEKIRSLHVEKVPIWEHAFGHALSDQDEECGISSPFAIKKRRSRRRIERDEQGCEDQADQIEFYVFKHSFPQFL